MHGHGIHNSYVLNEGVLSDANGNIVSPLTLLSSCASGVVHRELAAAPGRGGVRPGADQ